MAEAQTNKDRLRDITASIETGIKELFDSDNYRQYLTTMSRFHKYSVNNTMLIYLQRPNATLVAGFNKWKDQFGRNVMKGETGIKIIAPTPFKKKIEQEKLDPDTRLPMLDSEGKIITEEKEIKIPMYKPVTVFDMSQTQGKPLPQLAADLQGNVQNYDVFMEALKRSAPVPIVVISMTANMDGYFDTENQCIAIREGMSEVQTVSATIHEIAHSKLHNKDLPEIKDQWKLVMVSDGGTKHDHTGGFDSQAEAEVAAETSGRKYVDENRFEWRLEVEKDTSVAEFVKKSRNTEEVEAESISYAVCAYYGIATGENSLGYIASWSKGKELSELRESLETISKTSSALITDIDRNYAEIMKEHGLDKAEQESEQTEATDNPPTEPQSEHGVEETPAITAPDNGCEPDPAISVESMNTYGYTDADMLPLTKDRALELAERDVTVYLLHPDNTEAMAFDIDEIRSFVGIFGVTREDWDAVKAKLTPAAQKRDMEADFLSNTTDTFAIYQLKDTPDMAELHFVNTDYLKSKGLEVDRANYVPVYTGALGAAGDEQDKLNELYRIFNIDHPTDFTGHSLSVSDIVALKQAGAVSCHYVDSWGFKEIPGFIKPANYLKNAEMAMEDDYNQLDGIVNNGKKETTAELEEKVKSGKPISLLDYVKAARREAEPQETLKQPEKKSSVLARLQSSTVENTMKTAPKKSAERELL